MERYTSPLIGRWNLTLDGPWGKMPMWLEVHKSGIRTLVGQFCATHGSARPVSHVEVNGDAFRFAIPPQWERSDGNLVVEGQIGGEEISGTLTYPDGKSFSWTGRRAPALRRAAPPSWGAPVELFNGKDLSGWRVVGGENNWVVEDGILRNTKHGGNLITEALYDDFQLHIEFRLPPNGNSGVYLRGRYEVQLVDDPRTEPATDLIGAVYGLLTPSELVTNGPGEWDTFDITLVGRMVSIVINGKAVITNQAIPGTTGGALDSDEAAPGPIYLQGDHTAVEFRNIVLTPAL